MPNVLVQDSSLTAIANAIREKNGTEDTYKPAEMAQAILALSGSSSSGKIYQKVRITGTQISSSSSDTGTIQMAFDLSNYITSDDQPIIVSVRVDCGTATSQTYKDKIFFLNGILQTSSSSAHSSYMAINSAATTSSSYTETGTINATNGVAGFQSTFKLQDGIFTIYRDANSAVVNVSPSGKYLYLYCEGAET